MSEHPNQYGPCYAYCLPFGAQPCGLSGATLRLHFRLWAPAFTYARIEFERNTTTTRIIVMLPAGNGWFEAFVDCPAGTRYRYRLDGTVLIPDPASRSQPDGIAGASEVVNPRAFIWRHPYWRGRPWEEMALYALNVPPTGGYNNIRGRLPQLARLGITALKLLAAPQDGSDNLPFAPPAAYGGPDGLKALIDAAHGHGLAVLLELDYLHFGNSPNALHHYAQPFFQPHHDPTQAPTLALERPEVCDFFCENALYWIEEYRCDGLCLHTTNHIRGIAWLREIADRVQAAVSADRLVHFVLENEQLPAQFAATHFDAQRNRRGERALYRLTYPHRNLHGHDVSASQPIRALARTLTEIPKEILPLTSFILSGGAPFSTRSNQMTPLAALALTLLTPQIPLLFDTTVYDSSQLHFIQSALAIRMQLIAPRLADVQPHSATTLQAADGTPANALIASWRLADGEMLNIALNLSAQSLPFHSIPNGTIVFESTPRARDHLTISELPACTLIVWLTGDVNHYALAHRMHTPADTQREVLNR